MFGVVARAVGDNGVQYLQPSVVEALCRKRINYREALGSSQRNGSVNKNGGSSVPGCRATRLAYPHHKKVVKWWLFVSRGD